jgi:tetratricopeptide (TPR) repeat protein
VINHLAGISTMLRRFTAQLQRWFGDQKDASCAETPLADAHDTPQLSTYVEHRLKARALVDAIDRAVEAGQINHADRIAASALRLAHEHAFVAECIARLRLAQCDPERALALLETARHQNASLRLLKNACLIELGRRTEAHADLHQWSRQPTAPMDARIMLAMLEWEAGDTYSAMQALRHNLRYLDDARSLELLVLMSVCEHRASLAQSLAQRLRQVSLGCESVGETSLLLRSLGINTHHMSDRLDDKQVQTLAMELTARESVIPALVEAQRRSPRPAMIHALRQAIEKARPELVDQRHALEALASLSALLGDHAAARAWAQQALQLNPMSVTMATILRDATDAPETPTRSEPDATRDVIGRIGDADDASPASPEERVA